MFERALYRVRQLRRTLNPRITQAELHAARETLGERLYPLFASMQAADQRHCLDVYEALAAEGCNDREMLDAALLHDAGKGSIAGAWFGVGHRVTYVLLGRVPPVLAFAARFNAGLRALHRHDALTIALAREYGASPGVVQLLAAMEDIGTSDERARQLIDADDRS